MSCVRDNKELMDLLENFSIRLCNDDSEIYEDGRTKVVELTTTHDTITMETLEKIKRVFDSFSIEVCVDHDDFESLVVIGVLERKGMDHRDRTETTDDGRSVLGTPVTEPTTGGGH